MHSLVMEMTKQRLKLAIACWLFAPAQGTFRPEPDGPGGVGGVGSRAREAAHAGFRDRTDTGTLA
ncbi:hypothetical protein GCM10010317_058430 [Streptomyces mirabilis]|nr:hypothetical protein GCM10010317_058430 [Streptomyces mirabilis]